MPSEDDFYTFICLKSTNFLIMEEMEELKCLQ